MKTNIKTRHQRIHAKRRAVERYRVSVNRRTYESLIEEIQSGRAEFLGRQSNRVTIWRVTLAGRPARAVYDCRRKTIASFLPPEEREPQGGGA